MKRTGNTGIVKRCFRHTQTGSVLIISLLILLVMTLISVTAMKTSTVEEKMSGNVRDRNIAFQAAEAALRDAEIYAGSIASVTAFNGDQTGLYPTDADPDPFDDSTWANSLAGSYSDAADDPKYIIELVAEGEGAGDELNIGNYGESSGSSSVNTFRITARGTGKSSTSYVYLQEYYGRDM